MTNGYIHIANGVYFQTHLKWFFCSVLCQRKTVNCTACYDQVKRDWILIYRQPIHSLFVHELVSLLSVYMLLGSSKAVQSEIYWYPDRWISQIMYLNKLVQSLRYTDMYWGDRASYFSQSLDMPMSKPLSSLSQVSEEMFSLKNCHFI